jgi:hypothetical protein
MRSFIIVLMKKQAIFGRAVVRRGIAGMQSEKRKRRPKAPLAMCHEFPKAYEPDPIVKRSYLAMHS